MTFSRRAAADKIANSLRVDVVDEAFDAAIGNAREFGQTVAARIIADFRAGLIDRVGADWAAEAAIANTATAAAKENIPDTLRQQIVAALHSTIETELAAAGIPVRKIP